MCADVFGVNKVCPSAILLAKYVSQKQCHVERGRKKNLVKSTTMKDTKKMFFLDDTWLT
jgi:hypothetical protein